LPQILNIIIKSSWNETLLNSKKVKFEICKTRWVWFSNRILISRVKSIKNLYFRTALFLAGCQIFSNLWCYNRFSMVDLTKIWISLKLEEQTEFCKRGWIQLNNWYCLIREINEKILFSLLSNHLVEKLLLDDLINCFNVSTFNGLKF